MLQHEGKAGEVTATVLLGMKLDFPNHDGVGAGVVRDWLRVVASNHAGHPLGGPGQDPQSLHRIPARSCECPSEKLPV